MNALYPQNYVAYLNILLIFLRFLGLFLLVPGFSHQTIPMNVKILLALVLSFAFYPLLANKIGVFPYSVSGLLAVAMKETVIGLFMGFCAYLTFEAISLGSQIIGYQMGLGAANQIDPQNHAAVTTIVPLQGWIALMLFLLLNMHHQIVLAFLKSYDVTTAPLDFSVSGPLFKWLIQTSGQLFVLAIQMAAPFTFVLIVSQVVLGMLSRMIPQMNVFLFSFPITVLLGFATLYLVAPESFDKMENSMENMMLQLVQLIRVL